MAAKKSTHCKLRVTTPAGRFYQFRMPGFLAFTAARGIAKGTHCDASVNGTFGDAVFNSEGGGKVTWNLMSTAPGTVTEFDDRTTVCVY